MHGKTVGELCQLVSQMRERAGRLSACDRELYHHMLEEVTRAVLRHYHGKMPKSDAAQIGEEAEILLDELVRWMARKFSPSV